MPAVRRAWKKRTHRTRPGGCRSFRHATCAQQYLNQRAAIQLQYVEGLKSAETGNKEIGLGRREKPAKEKEEDEGEEAAT